MSVAQRSLGTGPPARGYNVLVLAGLAGLVLAAHAGALSDGVFYDDHLHRATMASLGWSWHDLIESTTFEFPDGLVRMWWQDQPVQFRYPRPVTMLIMKLQFLAVGGSAAGMHACNLAWHALCALLVYRLALWAIGAAGWAFLAAAAFALNPNSTFTVGWCAALNALVGTFFLLGAVLAYARASFTPDRQPGRLRLGWLALAVLAWGLALFSREAAIVLPLLAAALDGCFGGVRHLVRRFPVHAGLGLLALVYVYWRLYVFPVADFPAVYFSSPTGAAYVPWAASRLLQLIFALLLYLPLFGALDVADGWTGPLILAHVLMLALLVPGLVAVAKRSHGLPGRWFWPLWIVLLFLPVVPISPMPHFLYAPFAGYAIGLAAVLARLPRRRAAATVLLLVPLLAMLGLQRVIWRGVFRAEQLIYADMRSGTPPPPAGSTVFLLNAPTWATFLGPATRAAWGVPDLSAELLTLAPEPFRMRRESTIQQVGPRELLVSTPPPGYFGSGLERAMLKMTRRGEPVAAGRTYSSPSFDVTVLEQCEAGGITKLKFTFPRPLDSPEYHFYAATPQRAAARLRFATLANGAPAGSQPVSQDSAETFRAAHAPMLRERDRLTRIIDLIFWR